VTAIASLDYTWDWRNRLASAERSGGGITSYGYDHTGQRVFQATGSATTSYPSRYYNVASSSLTATTTKHIFSPDGTLLATVVGASTTATTTYLHPDHLGGTNVATDEDGEVVQTLDYYPYGSQRINSGSSAEQRRFIGEEFDPETEFSYLNARYYEGSRGQFLSQDPEFLALGSPGRMSQLTQRELVAILADPQSWNSYGYARGNPILLKDSTGKWWELSASGVIPGRAFTGGIRFDRNGIDVFGGGGIGIGLAGGIEVGWAPDQDLSHRPEGSISLSGTAANVLGGRITQYILTVSGVSQKRIPNGKPVGSLMIGGGLGISIQEEISTPFVVWGQPRVPQTAQPQPTYTAPASTPAQRPSSSSSTDVWAVLKAAISQYYAGGGK
jgi:RHS repeat-associated protein